MYVILLTLLSFFPHAKKPEISLYLLPENDTVKAVLYLSYNRQDLIFKKAENKRFEADVEVQFEVFDREKELIYGNYWTYIYTVSTYRETKESRWFSRTISVRLPRKNEYKFRITVKNREGDIIVEKEIKRTAPLTLSDPIPVNPGEYEEGKRKISSIYVTDSILGVYILNKDDSIKVNLRIEDEMRRKLREWQKTLVPGDNLLCIPIHQFDPGEYKFTIKAENEERELIFYKTGYGVLKGKYFKEILSVISYIATQEEIDSLKNAKGEELERLWKNFWKRRDPTPETPQNEFEEEFWRRVEYADEHFSSGLKPGYKSDRGIVYIKLGPPDEIERHPFDLEAPAYEIWYYYSLNYKFIFMDKKGVGDYELVYPPRYIFDELIWRD